MSLMLNMVGLDWTIFNINQRRHLYRSRATMVLFLIGMVFLAVDKRGSLLKKTRNKKLYRF